MSGMKMIFFSAKNRNCSIWRDLGDNRQAVLQLFKIFVYIIDAKANS